MVSLPEEKAEDVQMTVDLYDELRALSPRVVANYAFTEIYPGTELETRARELGILPRDFSWNKPYEFPRNKLYGFSPDIPMFENPDFSIEEIKAIIARRRGTKGALKRGWRRLKKVRSIEDLKNIMKLARNYLRQKK